MVRITAASLMAVTATYLQSVSAIREIDMMACFGDTQIPFGNQYFAIGQKRWSDRNVNFRCWAEAGEVDIDITNIVTHNSGNNAGFFDYEPGDGWRYRRSFGKGVVDDKRGGKGWGAVVKIHIN